MHKIFVGNLPYQANASQLQEWFMTNGFPAQSVSIIVDRFSGQPRGFGFVEMSVNAAGDRAIAELNGRELDGRALNVNEAKPKTAGGGGGGMGRKPNRW